MVFLILNTLFLCSDIYSIKNISFSRILKHEWNNYLKDKTDAKLAEVKELALKRYNIGIECIKKRISYFPVKYFCWHLHDLLVCQSRILKNNEAFEQARNIMNYLKENPDRVSIFCEIAGIRPEKIDLKDNVKACNYLINTCNYR